MIKVYSAQDIIDAHLMVALLREHGIDAVVQGEMLEGLLGGLPRDLYTSPSVCVLNDADAPRAAELIQNRPKGVNPSRCPECGYDLRGLPQARCPECGATFQQTEPWTCAHCGAKLEGQFTTCWRCGTDRPEASS